MCTISHGINAKIFLCIEKVFDKMFWHETFKLLSKQHKRKKNKLVKKRFMWYTRVKCLRKTKCKQKTFKPDDKKNPYYHIIFSCVLLAFDKKQSVKENRKHKP